MTYCTELRSTPPGTTASSGDEKLLHYKDDPVHDWASHAMDMLHYTAVVEEEMINEDRAPVAQPIHQPAFEYKGQVQEPSDFDKLDILMW